MTGTTKSTRRKARSQSRKAAEPANDLKGAATTPPAATKIGIVTGLLCREGGARLEELVAATGWQPHTTRAALTGLRKKGHTIAKDKVAGVARYSIAAAGTEAADAQAGNTTMSGA